MSKNVAIAVAVIIILVIAGWYFTRSKPASAPEVSEPTSTASGSAQASSSAMMEEKNMVTISSTGYSTKDMTIKAGESVTWNNSDTINHTVNSDAHPTHTLYPILNLGLIKAGEKKSVTFEKVGKYTYHDHLHPSNTGSVTVE